LDRSHTGQRGQTVGDGLDEWIRHHHTVPDPTLGVEVTWRTHPNDDEMRGEGPGRGRGQAGCRSSIRRRVAMPSMITTARTSAIS
jgi:hypothetical protein